AVVETVRCRLAGNLGKNLEAAAVRIEDGDGAFQRHDQPAAFPEPDGAHDLGHGPGAMLRAVEPDGVDRRRLDVDEEQDLAAVVPDGAFADAAAHVLEQSEFEHQRTPRPAGAASAMACAFSTSSMALKQCSCPIAVSVLSRT